MEPKIIYKDEAILILDKPAGWVVNEAKTTKDTPVIQTWVKENFHFPISNSRSLRNGVVHRLDKETSGVLIVAKTRKAFKSIQEQFKKREVKKSYIALVHGRLVPKRGTIKLPIGRLPWSRERFGVLPGGRDAITKYQAGSNYIKDGEEYTFAEFTPETGRTHQIRVHTKYLGHPIVSDSFYAGRKTARKDRKWCPRLFLHAHSIKFTHPTTAKVGEFKSSLSKDLRKVLKSLEKQPQSS